jgi:hypothetical protein
MRIRGWHGVAVTVGLLGFLACAGGTNYDACKKAGGDTESGTCVKPDFRCDGELGSRGSYHNVWYICQGDPPRWAKDPDQT